MTATKSPDGGTIWKPSISVLRGEQVLSLGLSWDRLSDPQVSFLQGMPAMIRQNGLGQTIALLRCKAQKEIENTEDGDKNMCKILNALTKLLVGIESTGNDPRLLNAVLTISDFRDYSYMQEEAIEYAGWMKKFAVAAHPGRNTREDAA